MADPLIRDADVAVIGAGLAGLSTARGLAAAGASVVVVEARERVGGRVLNEDIGGGNVVEVGAQWIGPTQDRLAALAAELGVDTFPTHTHGQNVFEYGGRLRRYSGTIPRINPLVLVDVERAQRKLNRLARTVPAGGALGSAGRRASRLADGRHLAPPQRGHPRGTQPPPARDRGRVGRGAGGHVAAPHALLHPLRGEPPAALRHRGRGAAGPLRRRLAATGAPHGGGARRASGCCSAGRCARSGTARTAWWCGRTGRTCARGARSWRWRPRSPAASRTTRRCRAIATSSPSGCRSGPWPSAWPSTTSRSGAPTACPARRRATPARCGSCSTTRRPAARRACSSGSSRATTRAGWAGCRPTSGAPR